MSSAPQRGTLALVPTAPATVEAVAPASQALAVTPVERLSAVVPDRPTRREKQVGREVALRQAVLAGQELLHREAAITIGRMHDTTHQALVAGICAMNARTRAIVDPDDRAELAAISIEQKAMYTRHQFGLLEAAAYRVAQLVERELYVERGTGVFARLLGD